FRSIFLVLHAPGSTLFPYTTLFRSLHLSRYLRLGEGELKSGGFRRPSILSDALEALFGAVYLDGGFEAAHHVIARQYQPLVANRSEEHTSELQSRENLVCRLLLEKN